MSVAIGAVRYRFPDGTDFEGVGITPHIAIDRTVADFVSNRDSVLERARELAGVSAR
jgi:C-terminal processing protease CtpA/Prc